MIIIIMRVENFVAHLDGLGGTPVAHHWPRGWINKKKLTHCFTSCLKKLNLIFSLYNIT
jgi:hypothetical protein